MHPYYKRIVADINRCHQQKRQIFSKFIFIIVSHIHQCHRMAWGGGISCNFLWTNFIFVNVKVNSSCKGALWFFNQGKIYSRKTSWDKKGDIFILLVLILLLSRPCSFYLDSLLLSLDLDLGLLSLKTLSVLGEDSSFVDRVSIAVLWFFTHWIKGT